MNIVNKKSITLTELLVASILIGIVMLGVAAFSISINRLQNLTSTSAVLTMQTTAAMSTITKDVMQAIGDETDRGIFTYFDDDDFNSLCVRIDIPVTPEDYSDDTWICYFHGDSFTLRRVVGTKTPSAPDGCTTSAACKNGGTETPILEISKAGGGVFAEIVNDADSRFEYVEITVTGRINKDQDVHPITNPEYTLTTRISPPGQSR